MGGARRLELHLRPCTKLSLSESVVRSVSDEAGDGVRGGVEDGDDDGVRDRRPRVEVCPILVLPELPTINGGLPVGGVERWRETRLR